VKNHDKQIQRTKFHPWSTWNNNFVSQYFFTFAYVSEANALLR
jgi:hypothetical protein